MSRAAFLGKLREVAPELLPVVRLFHGSVSVGLRGPLQGRCPGRSQGRPRPAAFALGLGSEIGGRTVFCLVRLRPLCAPPAVRAAAYSSGPGVGGEPFLLRSSSPLRARPWAARAPLPGPSDGSALDCVLDFAANDGPSRLPLRPYLGTARGSRSEVAAALCRKRKSPRGQNKRLLPRCLPTVWCVALVWGQYGG